MAKKKNKKAKLEIAPEVDVAAMAADALSAAKAFDDDKDESSEVVVASDDTTTDTEAEPFLESDDANFAAEAEAEAEADDFAQSDEVAPSDDMTTDEDIIADIEGFDDSQNVAELAQFESAEIEEIEEISEEEMVSAIESLLFATDKPQSVAMMKAAFQGTKVRAADIRAALEKLQIEYADPKRGVTLEEIAGGYQLRTKASNQKYLHRTVKARPFRLSGPALEVLSIVAYKQPCTKSMVDEIRGVESGHLMRGLLDRGLIHFGEKSDLPGRPMFYETTRKFLEIFNLRNLQELPTLNEIDQLIPEGIGEPQEEKKTLSDLTGELSNEVATQSYSVGEDELIDISSELQTINTSTEFFEQEKRRQREKRDADRAQDIRERITVGEQVDEKDKRWLARYELTLKAAAEYAQFEAQKASEQTAATEAAAPEGIATEGASTDAAVTESVAVEGLSAEGLATNTVHEVSQDSSHPSDLTDENAPV